MSDSSHQTLFCNTQARNMNRVTFNRDCTIIAIQHHMVLLLCHSDTWLACSMAVKLSRLLIAEAHGDPSNMTIFCIKYHLDVTDLIGPEPSLQN